MLACFHQGSRFWSLYVYFGLFFFSFLFFFFVFVFLGGFFVSLLFFFFVFWVFLIFKKKNVLRNN